MATTKKRAAKKPSAPTVSKKNIQKPGATRDASARGKMARQKGKVWEREGAARLQPIYPKARRSHGQSRTKGEAPDVTGTEWWLEFKDHRTLPARKALEQAIEERAKCTSIQDLVRAGVVYETETNGAPVVVLRHTGKRPDMVVMVLEDWLTLVAKLVQYRKAIDEFVDK